MKVFRRGFWYWGIRPLVIAAFLFWAGLMAWNGQRTDRFPVVNRPLQEWRFDDHQWVLYKKGGVAHHPECPCRTPGILKEPVVPRADRR